MGRLLWLPVLCLTMFLLYLLILSLHFSIMISLPKQEKFFFTCNYK